MKTIFSDTIARNIAVSDDEPDIERIRSAARVANTADYIEALPLGYNTMIGQDGQGVSQGQRQRILIARVVYKNPMFVFLDEATNVLMPIMSESSRIILRHSTKTRLSLLSLIVYPRFAMQIKL